MTSSRSTPTNARQRRRDSIPQLSPSMLLTLACILAQLSLGYESSVAAIVPLFVGSNSQTSSFTTSNSARLSEAVTLSHVGGIILGAILTFLVGARRGKGRRGDDTSEHRERGADREALLPAQAQVIAGRAISGIGGGFVASTAPVWQVEAAEIHLRGRLVVIALLAKGAGVAVGSWVFVAYASSASGDGSRESGHQQQPPSWRLPVALQLVPLAVLFGLLSVLPESARWLISRGKRDEALKAIARTHRLPPDNAAVTQEFHRLQVPSDYDCLPSTDYLKKVLAKLGWYKLLDHSSKPRSDRAKLRMTLAASLLLLVQLTGGSTFQFFFQVVPVNILHLRYHTSNLINAAAVTWTVVCGCAGIWTVDRLGRRGIIMLSFAVLCLTTSVMTALLATSGQGFGGTAGPQSSRRNVIAAYTLSFLFAGTWMILTVAAWLYQVEINAWNSRVAGSAAATVAVYAGGTAASYMTPAIIEDLGGLMGTPFIAVNALALGLAYLFLPETVGRSLEWLDWYYCHGCPVLVFQDRKAVKRRWTPEDEARNDGIENDLQAHQSLHIVYGKGVDREV